MTSSHEQKRRCYFCPSCKGYFSFIDLRDLGCKISGLLTPFGHFFSFFEFRLETGEFEENWKKRFRGWAKQANMAIFVARPQIFSLSEGIFPSSFKQAIVHPLLKKPSLPDDDLNNFRPISNLNFISKILEKVVASRIQPHLLSNSLSSSFQSAYRMFHSTETTLLGIHNDLILAMDRGEVTSLILLDLSAAFDTVDHSILLHRLQHWFGLHGTSLDWFSSYLTSRSQAVSIQNSTSSFSNLSCGVPQGSVLGPLLFTLYTTPLGSVISKNSIKYHLYADDTQLYISFTPSNSTSSLEMLSNTFSDILSWMNSNKIAPQSIQNWIPTHWYKTTTAQIFSTYNFISRQWYHPSQLFCS